MAHGYLDVLTNPGLPFYEICPSSKDSRFPRSDI